MNKRKDIVPALCLLMCFALIGLLYTLKSSTWLQITIVVLVMMFWIIGLSIRLENFWVKIKEIREKRRNLKVLKKLNAALIREVAISAEIMRAVDQTLKEQFKEQKTESPRKKPYYFRKERRSPRLFIKAIWTRHREKRKS